MAGYCLFDNLAVTDPAKFEDYKVRVAPIVGQFGGRYVVLAGQVDLVEGDWCPRAPVMIEFPDLARAHEWYRSEAYRDLREQRLAAGRFNAVFMQGV